MATDGLRLTPRRETDMTHIGTSREAVETMSIEQICAKLQADLKRAADAIHPEAQRLLEIAAMVHVNAVRAGCTHEEAAKYATGKADQTFFDLLQDRFGSSALCQNIDGLKAELAALKAERDGLRKALKPFAVALSIGRKSLPVLRPAHIREIALAYVREIALAYVTLDHLKAANAALGDA
jgi:hypothetical protein